MGYSIEAAQESGLFDAVIVSTDDPEIAGVAESFGAEVPFQRPAELSGDHAATLPVVRHAIDWYEENRGPVELVCCIYATAPFVKTSTLRAGLDVLEHQQAEFSFPVTTFPFPIRRGLTIHEGRVEMIWPEHAQSRSQDLTEAYHDAGQFYWGTRDAYRNRDHFFTARSAPVVIPRHWVQDIDTTEDWIRAEHMYRAIFGDGNADSTRELPQQP